MDNPNSGGLDSVPFEDTQKGYALSGKIMLSAIVILFAVVVLMVVLHLYARWYIVRQRRRVVLNRRRNHRRTHIVFYVDSNQNTVAASNSGLEPAVLNSLPVLAYSSKTHPEVLECAVCLSEFEENEKGRLLPKCNHFFHTECIDMWFHSHSTCPLCRSPVERSCEPENPVVSLSLPLNEPGRGVETEPDSSSDLCSECQHDEENATATTPTGGRRKLFGVMGVRIEVPSRTEPESELVLSSPASHVFRSPGSRLLSLKRILSMSRKNPTGTCSPSSGAGPSSVPLGTDLDLESGFVPSREQTPR